jgi:hypothetical protein
MYKVEQSHWSYRRRSAGSWYGITRSGRTQEADNEEPEMGKYQADMRTSAFVLRLHLHLRERQRIQSHNLREGILR